MKKFFYNFLTLVTGALLLSFLFKPFFYVMANSADFSFNETLRIDWNGVDDYVTVNKSITISNYSHSYLITKGTEYPLTITDIIGLDDRKATERSFKKESLQVFVDGNSYSNYKIKDNDSDISVIFIIPRDIKEGQSINLSIRYKTHDMLFKYGRITKIITPQLASSFQDQKKNNQTGIVSNFSYGMFLEIPNSVGEADLIYGNYTQKPTHSVDKVIYKISEKQAKKGNLIFQFGKDQLISFKIVIKTPETVKEKTFSSQFINTINQKLNSPKNIYKIRLFRNMDENNQRVYLEHIPQEVKHIYSDELGNVYGEVETPAGKPTVFYITGVLSFDIRNRRQYSIPNMSIKDYKAARDKHGNLGDYITGGRYWETNDPVIQQNAVKLLDKSKNLSELVNNDLEFVANNLEYDKSVLYKYYQADETFSPLNETIRKGAVKALQTKSGVCMEYSDLMITLLRAQGIPTRVVLGFGTNFADPFNSSDQTDKVRHQWLQIWVPDNKWVSVDPTWYDTSSYKFIGPDTDHIFIAVGKDSTAYLSNIVMFTADHIEKNSKLDLSYNVTFKPVAEDNMIMLEKLTDLNEIVTPYSDLSEKESILSTLNFFLKTTALGRLMIIIAPFILVFIAILLLFSIIKLILKLVFKKKK